MDVVVVESPAKARTINRYLGDNFRVLASYGHVRDLPSKDGSVRPDENFAMTYVPDPRASKHLSEIAKALKGAEHLYLATDPDREGEAISWHVLSVLQERNAVDGIAVKRVAFNEVTKRAVLDALKHPRDLDMDLVNAQQARRALDYLVGFTLSPVLWRKLPGARSAGRVQSVALRLICERELEIEAFTPREYWSIVAEFTTTEGVGLSARLTHLGDEKLTKFSLGDEAAARAAVERAMSAPGFAVANVEAKQNQRHPPPPFTTSTLQQEASRKLRFAASHTMRIAQRLYEGVDIGGETVGLISYMRTDGVQIAGEAIADCRGVIGREYGPDYVPEQLRAYRTKAKNAQEAHEAVRPTDAARLPKDMARFLDNDQARLYELVWKRTMASQMQSARIENTAVDIAPADGGTTFRANGSVLLFDGFLRLYQEGRDDQADEKDDEQRLPKLVAGETLARGTVTPSQHFTEPPPRFTEATLVKRLEELGIGRPSTYASIIDVLRDRAYVQLDKGRFVPEDRGRLVTAFLTSFFRHYVEYGFTADLETKLDDISTGKVAWTAVMHEFWGAFSGAVAEISELRVRDVLDALNEELGPYIFHSDDPNADTRACPSCEAGRLSVKTGRYGAFVGCSNYPECRFTRALADANGGEGSAVDDGPRELGTDTDSGLPVSLRRGPYGPYVQLGDSEGDVKPKRVSLPKELGPDDITLAVALGLLSLPRAIGQHPETAKEISAGIGRYGPYIRHERDYRSLAADDDVLTIGINRAVALLAEPKSGRRSGPKELRDLGAHPEDGKPVRVMDGRYGPYVTHGRVNATLPNGLAPDEIDITRAVDLLRERASRKKSSGRGSRAAKKTTRRSSRAASAD